MKIPIVNEQDEVLDYIDRNNRSSDHICRVSALWLTDRDGNILLAQRAFDKIHHPGLWGPAVAGTVEEGETYESNIIKESEEEIGLVGVDFTSGPKLLMRSVHSYHAQWFTAVAPHEYPFVKQDREVEQVKWFSKEEIAKLLKESPEIFIENFDESFKYFTSN